MTENPETWECLTCGFRYDEKLGLPADGIAPGTPWQQLPDDWTCPDCSAPKSDFHVID